MNTLIELSDLEDELLTIAEDHKGVHLEHVTDDEDLAGMRVERRDSPAVLVVWTDGEVQLYADGDEDAEPTDHTYESPEQLWQLLKRRRPTTTKET